VEVKKQTPAWLDESHPNYDRWQRARDLSIERGKFVQSVVTKIKDAKNLTVLDLGSGEGGTAKVFSENNFVVSLDLSFVRLQRQQLNVISSNLPKSVETNDSDIFHFDPDLSGKKSDSLNFEDFSFEDSFEMTVQNCVNGTALKLPFLNHAFDLIVIQDVIEHLSDLKPFYFEVKRVLMNNGIIYLSTPNKFSIFNFFNDPHFGLPIVSVLKRESIKEYFLRYFRKDDYNRSDVAQLLSLSYLRNIFKDDFEVLLQTQFSVQELINGNKGIVWSDFHLKIISVSRLLKIDRLIIKIANNKFGFINKYFTPTFYIILRNK
jgi:SAM-dependent methyltransferase